MLFNEDVLNKASRPLVIMSYVTYSKIKQNIKPISPPKVILLNHIPNQKVEKKLFYFCVLATPKSRMLREIAFCT